jgi:hypothetical protein
MTSEVLDAAFRLFRAGLLRCLPYSGLAALMLEIPKLYSSFQGTGQVLFEMATPLGRLFRITGMTDINLVQLISALLDVALLGMITLRLTTIARGLRPRFRSEVALALRRWVPACVASFAGLVFPALMLRSIWLFNPLFPEPLWPAVAALLLFPSALLAVTLPAFWSDGLRSLAAIVQAVRISCWSLGRMIGAILATLCILAVFYLLVVILIGILSPLLGRADLFLFAAVGELFYLVAVAIGVPFVVAVLIVAHADLKLRHQQRRGARQ